MPIDPYWDKVSLLLDCNGTDGSTTFTDKKGKTVTAKGNAQIDTSNSKFGGASALFDGDGDYLEIDAHADFEFGTGDFTVEFWMDRQLTGSQNTIMYYGSMSASTFAQVAFYVLWSPSNGLVFTSAGAGASFVQTIVDEPLIAGFNFVMMVRESGVTKIRLNGVEIRTLADTIKHNAGPSYKLLIGKRPGGSFTESYFKGHLDDIRITKGIARPNIVPTLAFDTDGAPIYFEIDETLAAEKFMCTAILVENGLALKTEILSSGPQTLQVPTEDPVYLTVAANIGKHWTKSTAIIINKFRFPTDPVATPYYFKVTSAGTTGATEPTWDARPGYTTVDGTVTWECVERLVQPITHGPLIPQ